MCALDAGQWLNHVHLLMADFGPNSANAIQATLPEYQTPHLNHSSPS